jgi:uracil DNA glycosylase
MEWKKFENKFDKSFHKIIKPFIESVECDNIYKQLKEISNAGDVISPASINLYRPFKETSLNNLKCVIIGENVIKGIQNELPVSDGLFLSNSLVNKTHPDLISFYDGIENDLYNGMYFDYYINPDLTYLANQGVLFLTLSMTCTNKEEHLVLWKPFIKYIISEIINKNNLPTILIGSAKKVEKLICPELVYTTGVLERNWKHNNVFSKINKVIKENNNEEIKWFYPLPF